MEEDGPDRGGANLDGLSRAVRHRLRDLIDEVRPAVSSRPRPCAPPLLAPPTWSSMVKQHIHVPRSQRQSRLAALLGVAC